MKINIYNREICLATERQFLTAYLDKTPVSQFAGYLNNGANLQKGFITSRDELGILKTIYSELGGISAKQEFGRDKFLVNEVLLVLKDSRCTGGDALNTILNYIESFKHQPVELVISMYEDADYQILVDGNKRIVACYEANHLPVPVYIISI